MCVHDELTAALL